jgi:DNA topoisomerase-1
MKKAKFKSLSSIGPLLPPEYQPAGYKVGGQTLSPLAEEMLWNAARYIGSDYEARILVTDGNFHNCLKLELNAAQKQLAFPKAFMATLNSMKGAQEIAKADKKALTKDEKLALKAEKDAQKEQYGFAILDGKRVPLTGYLVEPPAIIMTRGKDPRFGNWKYRVAPEDITINIVGAKPPAGWKGKVQSDPSSIRVMTYKIECGVPGSKTAKTLNKSITFAPTVSVRQDMIDGKFTKTSSILKNWKKIQKHIYDGCLAGNQAAMVAYLIQETGIRIGNLRDKNTQADTRGASTLTVDNIECFVEN